MTLMTTTNFKGLRKLLLLFYFCGILTLFWCFSSSSNDGATVYRQKLASLYADTVANESEIEYYLFVNTSANSMDEYLNITTVPAPAHTQPRYYVHSEHCKMPFIDPFSPEIMKTYKPLPLQNCTKVGRLVRTIFDANRQLYLLQIDANVGRSLRNFSGDISCCYKEIIRTKDDDDKISLLACTNFSHGSVVPSHVEGIIVECYSANRTKLLQRDGFTFVQMKNLTNSSTITNSRKPSVLMIGIDALSRINIRRTMVKTYQYLRDNNWHEMQGYNKMGDNTFPNLMAVLAGNNEATARAKYNVQRVGGIDACPFIWKSFQEYGYRTAYAEDECAMSTFNYIKRGFKDPPTHYYLRPFMLAFEQHLEQKKRCGLRNCLGLRHTAEYIYDYAAQLVNRYNNEPLFGFFWSNSFSHNCYDTTSAMDYVVHDYLKAFEESGALETSIVVFFSDHGMRWGTLTSLPDGFFEERLPMLFIWLPKWFAHQYPQYVRALEVNRNRLTSPYDLHMTLQHLVELASEGKHSAQPAENCPQCQSLFREVPENRTCQAAGIPEHWCTCTPFEVIKRSPTIVNITQLVVDEMNQYLRARNFSSLCSAFTSPKIESVFRKMSLNDDDDDADDDGDRDNDLVTKYRIKFETKPQKALFESTVIYYKNNNTIDVDVESISRLNSYEPHSKCVNDKQAKKYCICKDLSSNKKS